MWKSQMPELWQVELGPGSQMLEEMHLRKEILKNLVNGHRERSETRIQCGPTELFPVLACIAQVKWFGFRPSCDIPL